MHFLLFALTVVQILFLRLPLLCSSDVLVCVMEKGGLFMLVKIKFLGFTELWCEFKICDYIYQHVATPLTFTYLTTVSSDKVENQIGLI